ncbi:TPA: hypothetical protein ACQ30S_004110 [Yersinia enterocolitica]
MVQADSINRMIVPDDAVYLGTDMGGEFVTLKRQDIQLENGKTLPAFYISIYRAGSDGKAYGIDRIGSLVYSGLGLYVPPKVMIGDLNREIYEPPSISYIFGKQEGENNAGVNSDILWISLKPRSEDSQGKYVGMIMPLNLK